TRSSLRRPSPRQSGQGVAITVPRPPHTLHGELVTIWPRMLWRTRRTSPEPPQFVQRVGAEPSAAPDPSHVVQVTGRRSRISFSAPNTASSNDRSSTASASAPRIGPPRPPPPPNPAPPKNVSKMSPRPPAPKKSLGFAPPPAPPTPAAPNVS